MTGPSTRVTPKRIAAAGVHGFASVVGRRNAVRTARFATNLLRFDDQNQMGSNGERLIQQAARSRPGGVVFDVGANQGQWSSALLEGPGHPVDLHLFEPSSYSRGLAEEALGDRAQVHALALSSEPGSAELQIVREGAGVNSLVPFEGERVATTTETVEVETVDRFCAQHSIDSITLLKIDAEGLDLAVMRGAADLLAHARIGMVQFEYNWRWVFSRTYLRDAFALIEDLPRYSLGKVTPRGIELYDRWHHELETFRECNYILIRDDWRDRLPTFAWWGA